MNRFAILLAFLSLTALCSMGCRKESETANPPETTAPRNSDPATPTAREAIAPSPDDSDGDKGDEAPAVVSADVKALAQGNNQFAFDLYARLAKQDGNIIFSPYSISTALAMTYAGARGDTAEEMAKTLHFPFEDDRLHTAFADLSEQIMRPGKRRAGQLLVANSLWAQRGYPFRNEFLRLTHDDYYAELKEVDFRGDAERARQAINGWVEQQTQKMIQVLLKPGAVDKKSRLVLVNAIYFRSLWARPFVASFTKEAAFHTAAGGSVEVPLMACGGDDVLYFEDDQVQIVELPYQGKRLSMVIILPRAADGLAPVEADLTAGRVRNWLTKLTPSRVIVNLPKFSTTCDFQLGKELSAMGMPLAFSNEADFSGMSGEGRLQISQVAHQARVEVTEEGTKAAAATAVTIQFNSDKPYAPPKTFRADHPFVFIIRDLDTNSALFVGRVARPGS
jgi:serine protease inhibitor